MIDARAGTVRFDNGFEVGSQTEVDDFLGRDPNIHAEDFGVVNEFRVISFFRVKLWGRCFSAVLRFKNGRLHFVELTLNDGLLSKLGYDAAEKDIRSEKSINASIGTMLWIGS